MYRFRNNLLIKHEDKLTDSLIREGILNIRMRNPNTLYLLKAELEQYLAIRFNNYLFHLLWKEATREDLEVDYRNDLVVITDDSLIITGTMTREIIPNQFLLNIRGYRNFIIGNETSTKDYHIGLRLVRNEDIYYFEELPDCYRTAEEIIADRYV